jgi:hypothetical protein
MDFVLGLIVGVVAVVALLTLTAIIRRFHVRGAGAATPRDIAAQVRAVHPLMATIIESKPAVDPESAGPATVDEATVNAADAGQRLARLVRDPDLRDFLVALKSWTPQYHEAEASYGSSLQRYVARQSGVSANEFVRWPSDIRLRLEDDEGRVAPDFCFRKRVLVEIKGDLHTASETDRALGQMVRYLLAWKQHGPALLIVCGRHRAVYRALVRVYVHLWRTTLRIPVTVYFLRKDDPEAVPTSVDPAAWPGRALP